MGGFASQADDLSKALGVDASGRPIEEPQPVETRRTSAPMIALLGRWYNRLAQRVGQTTAGALILAVGAVVWFVIAWALGGAWWAACRARSASSRSNPEEIVARSNRRGEKQYGGVKRVADSKTQPDAWLNPAVATHSPHFRELLRTSSIDRNQVREGMPIRPLPHWDPGLEMTTPTATRSRGTKRSNVSSAAGSAACRSLSARRLGAVACTAELGDHWCRGGGARRRILNTYWRPKARSRRRSSSYGAGPLAREREETALLIERLARVAGIRPPREGAVRAVFAVEGHGSATCRLTVP